MPECGKLAVSSVQSNNSVFLSLHKLDSISLDIQTELNFFIKKDIEKQFNFFIKRNHRRYNPRWIMKHQRASVVERYIIVMDFLTWRSIKNLEKLTSGKFYLYTLLILNSTFYGVSCRITFLWIWSDLLYFWQLKEVRPVCFLVEL